jgi:hypothetical protein
MKVGRAIARRVVGSQSVSQLVSRRRRGLLLLQDAAAGMAGYYSTTTTTTELDQPLDDRWPREMRHND